MIYTEDINFIDTDDKVSLGTWYDHNGLRACKIDILFTIFKLCIIYSLMSIPFLFRFDGDIDLIIVYAPSNLPLYIYLTVTYLVMSYFITKRVFGRVNDILKSKYLYSSYGLDINDPREASFNEVVTKVGMKKEELMNTYLRIENFLIAMDEEKCLDTKLLFFRNLLTTMPFEVCLKEVIHKTFLENTVNMTQMSKNSDDMKEHSIKLGLMTIPFLPVLFFFTFMNHVLTYSNNSGMLSLSTYTRYGRWKLRLYNEFESHLKSRLQRTYGAAESVLSKNFNNSWKATGYKFLSFIASSFTTFGIYMTFHGYERLFGMDIIWTTGLMAMVSALVFPRTKSNTYGMTFLKQNLKDDLTVSELESYFGSKITILLYEILSIPLIPIVLIFLLPSNSYPIASFFHSYGRNGYCAHAVYQNRNLTPKTRKTFNSPDLSDSSVVINI